jgi:16S rRNA (uracil1498-N3)-methyltransferase
MENHNLYSGSAHLSNIELFYCRPENYRKNEVILEGDEYYHAVKVMRHNNGDELYITNGEGKIFNGHITVILKDSLRINVKKEFVYKNELSAVTFCIPKLKNPERFEFALEKCTELGVTNFIIFESERTISKSLKIERWQKILLAAMKQSLRSYLPAISTTESIKDIKAMEGVKIVFEQNAENIFHVAPKDFKGKYYFIFGPEGGFSEKELSLFKEGELFKLADNRLRSETAVIKCAALITAV